MSATTLAADDRPTLLLVDDDVVLCAALSQALSRRGFAVAVAQSAAQAATAARANPPEFAVVDLRMPGESGLAVIKLLRELDPETRIVVLTGYGSIATAVEAIKLGAIHYLAKPANADEIVNALAKDKGDAAAPIAMHPQSIGRLEWEHVQKVLAEQGGNISATARVLHMHRRTLQRKLAKRPRGD